ncbi:peptidyl-prolyl cis-trans isomerase FKBP43 isoform X2 [Eucalyptus grandis]|uniref:peptidyl-prolyl cis-trans isomerase FKBP43 isoform X2 n=1 Tax=Eucalyptus grandis TaxID=71139 RepID=UPI00192EC67F|nr:peptidyl-prolyl cis-trans isomerase FKBP43 isoform X2 [Eucalyptus grandis]
MAFWGVEVKPGKPFVHPSSGARQRLHISQATLGIGSATNKSIVQCNVGNKSPVFLCSLFPDGAESSQLNLEFEEAEEVTFSVVGPRSVHLSGFYLGSGRHYAGDDESESYGEDIAGTDTERSNDEDDYEDSFIDDDDNPEIFSPSPSPSLNDAVHGESDNEKARERKGRKRRLRKKYHLGESDEKGSFEQNNIVDDKAKAQASESEDEEGFFISSLLKKKDVVKDSKIDGPEEKPQSGIPEVGTKMKRKRNEEFIESHIEVDKANTHDKVKESQGWQGQGIAGADKEAGQVNGFAPTSDEATNQNALKKRKKKHANEKSQPEEDIVENSMNPVVPENLALDAPQVTGGADSEKKDIKKKKKKDRAQHSEADITNQENVLPADGKVRLDTKMKDTDTDDACQVRKLPNGLTIEELEIGNPDGKVTASGKKISVCYVGKFMENGLVFDSNISGKPLKFRLGSGEVMKGWDDGLDGMRIGGKRRLTIPPSLCCANSGTSHKVPPDSWLVYDIEVVRVR